MAYLLTLSQSLLAAVPSELNEFEGCTFQTADRRPQNLVDAVGSELQCHLQRINLSPTLASNSMKLPPSSSKVVSYELSEKNLRMLLIERGISPDSLLLAAVPFELNESAKVKTLQ